MNKRIVDRTVKPRFMWFGKLFSFIRKLLIVVASISFIAVVSFYGMNTAQQFLNRPIVSIVVEGDFTYINKRFVANKAKAMIGDSFVGENINELKAQIESSPWIDSVNLYRQWPDRLMLSVTEEVPIARWGDRGFVNVRGELIYMANNDNLKHLALLSSDKEDSAVMVQQYSMLTQLLQPYQLSIRLLAKDSRESWQASLDNGWILKLGKGNLAHKVQQFNVLLEQQLLTTDMNVAVADMRYNNGVAVEWIAIINNSEKQQLSSAHLHNKQLINKQSNKDNRG